MSSLGSATYAYLANSRLISQIAFTNNGTRRMLTTRSYDNLDRLTSISSATNSSTVAAIAYAYGYNSANQRTVVTNSDNTYWQYTYDSLGQLTAGRRRWMDGSGPSGSVVAGQQFLYTFDHIGNRTQAKTGDGNRTANYTNNTLNQLTGRGVPGYIEVLGVALGTNTVTVNGQTASRKGEYFRKELAVDNSTSALWTNITVSATNETSVSGKRFLPKAVEQFYYDEDGNLTNDGRWVFTWDAENRLVKVESLTATPQDSWRRVEWEFDSKGRRIRQRTSSGSTGSYVVTEDLKFLSDGWKHIADLNATNNNLIRSYAWGLDLSGGMDGAGGVGGLLFMNSVANGTHCYAYDGNGNVGALVKASDGGISARYEYGPFGEVIRASGPVADENRFQFSTKRCDRTTDFVLYEYRVYVPSTGRWPNRDPIEEEGGVNLYVYVEGDPVNFVDLDGLTKVKKHATSITQQQAMHGIWGWTDLESEKERPAKLKQKRCVCVVKKKPEMEFTLLVQTARKGKQSWTESAVFDGVTYPNTRVYVGSGLAKFSREHEEKRYQAWKTALSSSWPAHYEDPAGQLTAPTCPELQVKIDQLRQKAFAEWPNSAEYQQMIQTRMAVS